MKKKILLTLLCILPIRLIAGSGDVNKDGVLNVADIVEMVNYFKSKPSSYFDIEAADVDNNGYIEQHDFVVINNLIMSGGNTTTKEKGLVISFDDGDMVFIPFTKELVMTIKSMSLLFCGEGFDDVEMRIFQEGYTFNRLIIKISDWFECQRELAPQRTKNPSNDSSKREYAKGDVTWCTNTGDFHWLDETQFITSIVFGYDDKKEGFYKIDFKNKQNESWTKTYKASETNRIEMGFQLKEDVDDTERQALVDFYNSTGGPNWTSNYGWATDIPVEYWYGVGCYDSDGYSLQHVGDLQLSGMFEKMDGEPTSLKDLPYLWQINFSGNTLRGSLDFLNGCTSLKNVILDNNSFSGEYPEHPLSDLMNQLGNMYALNFCNSGFSKTIPDWAKEHEKFKDFWPQFCYYEVGNKKFNEEYPDLILPAPDFTLVDMEGNIHKSSEEYVNHKLTILYDWSTWDETSPVINKKLIPAYNQFKDQGLQVIGLVGFEDGPHYYRSGYDTPESISTYCQKNNVTWSNVSISSKDNGQGGINQIPVMDFGRRYESMGNVLAVNNKGEIVFQSMVYNYPNDIISVIEKMFGTIEGGNEYYTSSDYSKDGEVVKLQSATEGNGVDLVFIGEAFTDKDMASSGKYEQKMLAGMEQLFSMEPYKSLRNRFNVYTVKVVSPNAEFASDAKHAINEDNEKAFDYAKKAFDNNPDRMLVCVIYNTEAEIGRSYCTMFVEDGSCVAYLMGAVGTVLNHEFGGHGIAKLKDEYVEPGQEQVTISNEAIAYLDEIWAYGAGANVDYHSNPSEVKWAHLVSDARYTNEVGVYEGAYTYGKGAYRPTLNSMMNDSHSPFNAPSREAIYKHVMKYSDPGWIYDFETFATFDAPMRSLSRVYSRQNCSDYSQKSYNISRPPIIIKGTWRDASKFEKTEMSK